MVLRAHGALLAARLMPVDFAKEDNGLHRCHVRVLHGLIFINLSEEEPVDFDATFTDLSPYLEFHGLADARIATPASYPTDANWKLVVENFVECYHCAPSHPEFVSMHPPQALVAFGAGTGSGPADAVDQYLPTLRAWEERAAALGRPIGTVDDGPESSHLRLLLQRTIREGYESETQDGRLKPPRRRQARRVRPGPDVPVVQPVHAAGRHQRFRGAVPFHSAQHAADGNVDRFWLVDGRASEVDVERMIWTGSDHPAGQDHHREQPVRDLVDAVSAGAVFGARAPRHDLSTLVSGTIRRRLAGARAALIPAPLQSASGARRHRARAPQAAARPSKSEHSRALRASEAARESSARASSNRPSLSSRSPRTLGSRWYAPRRPSAAIASTMSSAAAAPNAMDTATARFNSMIGDGDNCANAS